MLPSLTANEVHFDFAHGCRVIVPSWFAHWRVRMADIDSGQVLLDETYGEGAGKSPVGSIVISPTHYYTRWLLEVWRGTQQIVGHAFDCRDKPVLMKVGGRVGDTMSRMRAVLNFHRQHGCATVVQIAREMVPLFSRDDYEGIEFVDVEDLTIVQRSFYAVYSLGFFHDTTAPVYEPFAHKMTPMIDSAAYMLGVAPDHRPPPVHREQGGRPIKEPYVCIAVQATSQAKKWNNPRGWDGVVEYLKSRGLRVVCIDYYNEHHGTRAPAGADDATGPLPITMRALWLKHAEFFVGLPSGLSWLAWACGTPVLMIAGFSHPNTEFFTPYRVTNPHVCNGCFNDPAHVFDNRDFMWCPRHHGTPRQFECTTGISVQQVVNMIDRLIATENIKVATNGKGTIDGKIPKHIQEPVLASVAT
jgi:autotransporter strand-loop-strand O-heptosyltransferase